MGINIVSAMGVCLGSQVKAGGQTNSVSGLSSKSVNVIDTEDITLSSSASEISARLVPRAQPCVGEILQSSNLKSFALTELQSATRNFRVDSVLGGDGDFGSVFKGWIDEHSASAAKPGKGIVIAVKKLHQDGFKGHEEMLVY